MNQNQMIIKKIALVSMLLAIAIALDVITGIIPGLNLSMPLGGRIFNVALFPILLIGVLLGPLYGIIGAVIYGILGFFLDGYALAYFAEDLNQALLVFFLDYVIAFGALGLSGFFKKSLESPFKFSLVVIITMLIRWLSSTIVGAVLWVSYATNDEWTSNLLSSVGNQAFIYSGIYNGIYTLTTILTLIVIGLSTRNQLRVIKENYHLV